MVLEQRINLQFLLYHAWRSLHKIMMLKISYVDKDMSRT